MKAMRGIVAGFHGDAHVAVVDVTTIPVRKSIGKVIGISITDITNIRIHWLITFQLEREML